MAEATADAAAEGEADGAAETALDGAAEADGAADGLAEAGAFETVGLGARAEEPPPQAARPAPLASASANASRRIRTCKTHLFGSCEAEKAKGTQGRLPHDAIRRDG